MVTFPHMGNLYLSAKVMLDTIGIDYVIPPLCNKNTMEKGIKNSSEFICMPFKLLLGDIIWGLEMGADTVLFGGGCGKCRQGYYGEMHQVILDSLGYKYNYIEINLKKMSFRELIKKLNPLVKDKKKIKVILGILLGLRMVYAVDKLYDLANKTRCVEIKKGETDRILKEFVDTVMREKGYKNAVCALKAAKRKLKAMEKDYTADPVKIAIIGEIFIACEPFTNLEIEKKLGQLGAWVHNHLSISEWVTDRFFRKILPFMPKNKAIKASQEFMNIENVGGHGIHTVGNAVLSSKHGYDGIIQLYPFTCMPEIIAQSTFASIQKKYDIPIMVLVLDEMTGEAGYMTRLEAFVDMLKMRKAAKVKGTLAAGDINTAS